MLFDFARNTLAKKDSEKPCGSATIKLFNCKTCEQMKDTSLTGTQDAFGRWKHDCLYISGGAYPLTSAALHSDPKLCSLSPFGCSSIRTLPCENPVPFTRSLNTSVVGSSSARVLHVCLSTSGESFLFWYKSNKTLFWLSLNNLWKCQRRRQVNGKRLKSRNYARKRFVLAKNWNRSLIGHATRIWYDSF